MDKKEIILAKANGCLEKVYGQEVNKLIRQRYSESEELAIQRHRLNHPKAQSEEWDEYNDYCEQCKKDVKAEMSALGAWDE